jgi:hypothetical protein
VPISTDKNGNYGPPLVSQKYSPLANIQFNATDQPTYSSLLTNRYRFLTNANVLPEPLNLAVPNWANTLASEVGTRPPIVVISSNRANWIRAGVNASQLQLAALGLGTLTFPNESDLRALTALAGQASSPPIYCPLRVGVTRNVYVVVHAFEYGYYKNVLAGTGITVVGWGFRKSQGSPADLHITGFGASRFAAIEFCKRLKAGGARWDHAWLLDDNAVALTGFPGFTAVENAMTVNTVCAGFQGGTSAESFDANKKWANTEVAQGRGGQAAVVPLSNPPGILQQAVLWNINYLTANQLNFGLAYVTSGEDLSFGNHFDRQGIAYLYYGGITVRKENVDGKEDNQTGSQALSAARHKFAGWLSKAENADSTAPPPPPITVQPISPADGGAQKLSDYVTMRVLPNSASRHEANNDMVKVRATCQAVEQITCGAIGAGFVTAVAINRTFSTNQQPAQAVQEQDIP